MDISRNRLGAYLGAGGGLYETAANWRRELDLARELGMGVVRFNSDCWDLIQPTAKTFDFTAMDALVELIRPYSMDIVFTTPISARWNRATTADSHTATTDLQAVHRLITSVAARYRGEIRYYEAWNEPDFQIGGNGIFWKPAPNAAAYMEYLRVVSMAVRREDPNARVINGGLAMPANPEFMAALQSAGMMNFVDAVNIHVYPAFATPNQAMATVETVFGSGVPTIVTETSSTGARFESSDTQLEEVKKCAWLARTYQAFLSKPNVLAVLWHSLRNPLGSSNGTTFEYDFGLMKNDWTPLPALAAHRAFTSAIAEGAVVKEYARDVLGNSLTMSSPVYVLQ